MSTRVLIVSVSSAVVVGALAVAPTSITAAATAPRDPRAASAVTAPWAPADPQAPAARATKYSRVIATLRREIPQVMDEGGAVGLTIALVDGKRTLWARGFGLANRERGIPVTRRTLFHIGSTSKTMTAMAIMQLVERGLVDLDASLTRYIPRFRMIERFKRNVVTVRSIMTHHSGIPGDLMNLAEFGRKPDSGFYKTALRALRKEMPTRRVGKAWAYSNMAIQMLQGVVEKVSGMSFQRYTHRHIFKKLGMTSSTFDDGKQGWRRIAAPYEVNQNPDGSMSVVRRAREYINIRPAGSVYSNAVDMARYLKAMIGSGKAPAARRVLQPPTVQQMITPQKASPWDRMFFKQGLVWWIGYGAPWLRQVVNHGGDTYFHHSMAAWLPKRKLGVFVSVNTANPTNVTKQVWQRALALMLRAKTGKLPPGPKRPKPVVAPDRAEMRAMAGRYANSGGVLELEVDGDTLLATQSAQNPDAPTRALTRRSDGWYTSADGEAAYRMTRIEGHTVLLGRLRDGTQGLMAQRIPKGYAVSKVWRDRAATYRLTGVSQNVYPRILDDPRLVPMFTYRGILLLGTSVLRPVSDDLAFTFGPTPLQVMRDEGFSVEARNGYLRFSGARLVPLPNGSVTGQAAPNPLVSQWTHPLAPELQPGPARALLSAEAGP